MMNETVTSKVEPEALKDNALESVQGGTPPLFWDPLWWYVDRTGHLPTISVPYPH
jgi:hypothetical protein